MAGTNDEEVERYEIGTIDRRFVAGARDALYEHVFGRVLNLGLDDGVWDERLNEDTSVTTIGLDARPELVTEFATRYPNITYIYTDVFHYEPEEPFDTIIVNHLLGQVDDPIALLHRLGSWLRVHPKGTLIVVVPNADSVHRHLSQQMGLVADIIDLNDTDRELGRQRIYTRDLLKQHIREGHLLELELRELTFKAPSNEQLAQLPQTYVDACCQLHGLPNAFQLGAILHR